MWNTNRFGTGVLGIILPATTSISGFIMLLTRTRQSICDCKELANVWRQWLSRANRPVIGENTCRPILPSVPEPLSYVEPLEWHRSARRCLSDCLARRPLKPRMGHHPQRDALRQI